MFQPLTASPKEQRAFCHNHSDLLLLHRTAISSLQRGASLEAAQRFMTSTTPLHQEPAKSRLYGTTNGLYAWRSTKRIPNEEWLGIRRRHAQHLYEVFRAQGDDVGMARRKVQSVHLVLLLDMRFRIGWEMTREFGAWINRLGDDETG
jgi:CRP-like cAMP-binding protein